MSRPLRRSALTLAWLFLAAQVGTAARAEIVILDNGRFLKASSYEVDGESVRVELANGGKLVMPLLRIDRVIDDEIATHAVEEDRAVERGASTFVYLGFEADDQTPDTPFGELIFEVAQRRNVNPALVAAIIRAESAFDPDAVSQKGARGLMQLMPATGKRFGLQPNDLFDSELNIEAGVTYLEQLIETYSQDLPLVLAAYNAGEGAVARYRGVPPYRETQEYIRRVYSFLGATAAPAPTPGK
jgi:hypothetical protein